MPTVDWWKGEAGDAYTDRNGSQEAIVARTRLWEEILRWTNPWSIMEVGANIGLNLEALKEIGRGGDYYALEPNEKARVLLPSWVARVNGTAQKIECRDDFADLVFTCGVLIHVPPEDLLTACNEIYRTARRYVVCIEYFSAEPRMVTYRGENDRLWTRDFGSFYLDNFPLEPIECGFAWKRTTGLDNVTWWLFRKI